MLNYIDIIEARGRYYKLLDEACQDIYTELHLDVRVNLNCHDSIVIHTNEEIPLEKLKKLKKLGIRTYEMCHVRSGGYKLHYILHGKWEE